MCSNAIHHSNIEELNGRNMLQYEGEEELRFPSPELLLWRPLFHFEPLFREREREREREELVEKWW